MRFSELDKHSFREAVESGSTDKQLAQVYGVSSATIGRWRGQLRLKPNWEARRHTCGTIASYARGCRCTDCRAANTANHRTAVEKMRAVGLAEDDARHGTPTAYSQWGCRCDRCRDAAAAKNRAYQVSRFGSQRSSLIRK